MRRELPRKRRGDFLPNCADISFPSNRVIQRFEVEMLFRVSPDEIGH